MRIIAAVLLCAAGAAIGSRPSFLDAVPHSQQAARQQEAGKAMARASAMQGAGRYADAAVAGERMLQTIEAMPDLAPVDRARALVRAGELQWLAGDLPRARLHLKRGLGLLEEILGTVDPEVAAARTRLAMVLQAEGRCGQAEALYRLALNAQEASLGLDHVDVAATLGNLASLYASQGLYDQAERLHQRARRILEAAYGPEHPAVASSMVDLAMLAEAEGLHERAASLILRARNFQEKALGGSHPDVAASLGSLAAVYEAQGRLADAEPLARRALEIREAALGKHHPAVASSLHALAGIYLARGKLDEAGPLATRALAIRQAALGEGHPDVAASLQAVARLHLARGRVDRALPMMERSLALSEARLRREVLDFSEPRLAAFLQILRAEEESAYALAQAHPDNAGVQRLALAFALLRKGRSVEELANISRTVHRDPRLPDSDALKRLQEVNRRRAEIAGGAAGSLEELDRQAERWNSMVARGSAPRRAQGELPSPAEIVDRVAGALPPDAALVEIVAYAERPGAPRRARAAGALAGGGSGPFRYLALVLLPWGDIRSVDLGHAGLIDGAAVRLRDALASHVHEYLQPAQEVHALVFAELGPALGSARRVFISPDGQLALVPFAALHDGRRFLADAFEFTYLTSGRDLLPRPGEVARSSEVVVLADPELDQRWAALPGTRVEADALRHLFPGSQIYLGREATRERLLQVDAPGILHVATHGVFLQDAAGAQGVRGVASVGPVGGALQCRSSNPLLCSGLVLSGEDSARGDSVTTALELAGLNLWGTQLVVLSACDTGRGGIKLGQGVYGLRRALVAAGAETVVMSLWKVDDDSTHALMETYYRNLLAGQGRTAALHAAMQSLRADRPHPYYWAPFITLGKDAPLSLEAPPERVAARADLPTE